MKQVITIEQLSQLTDDEKIKLHDYWSEIKGGSFWKIDKTVDVNDIAVPLLTIGEMIEFFQLNQYRINLDNAIPASVTVPKFKKEFCEMELADALWEALKEVLGVIEYNFD